MTENTPPEDKTDDHKDKIADSDRLDSNANDPILLPAVVPIFPLSNVLLLPCAKLPLNIFEPRYLDMVDYALGHDRLIGMVQPREQGNEGITSTPPVYEMGCMGRITSFNETGDGRYGITLLGISRFTIIEEIEQEPGSAQNGEETFEFRDFRLAHVNYETFIEDLNDAKIDADKRRDLLKSIKAYLQANDIEADWGTIADAADYALITSLTMLCPFTASEKQALLECNDIHQRSELLGNLMMLSINHNDRSTPSIIH